MPCPPLPDRTVQNLSQLPFCSVRLLVLIKLPSACTLAYRLLCCFALSRRALRSLFIMGFKLKSLGRQLAGNMGKVAQGVADKLECSVIAPPMPVMLGALAVCAGAAVVRNIKNRRRKNHQKRSPQAPTNEVCASLAYSIRFSDS